MLQFPLEVEIHWKVELAYTYFRRKEWKELDAKGSGIHAVRVGYWEEIEGKGSGIYTVREGFWYL